MTAEAETASTQTHTTDTAETSVEGSREFDSHQSRAWTYTSGEPTEAPSPVPTDSRPACSMWIIIECILQPKLSEKAEEATHPAAHHAHDCIL
jgi:hypothetical protein